MMEIIRAWHWNPSLWPELKGALGGLWVAIVYKHLKGFPWHRKTLALLIVYLGAPMLSALAACIFAYDWIWPARLRPLPEDTDP